MKEFIALLAVANASFILGAIFGGTVYHAINRLYKKAESEVKEYASKGIAEVKSVL